MYCDVIGRETRLPFRIKGEGLGPKLQFSFDSLNIENVFINSPHAYEVYMIVKLQSLTVSFFYVGDS